MKIKKLITIVLTLILVLYSTSCFAISGDDLYSEAAILIDANSGKVLFEKNADQKMYPASTTKIMTAILTLENCNLDDVVTVNYNAISTIPSGYSIAALVTDEELTVKQLLEVLLVHSANDAANVLGMHVGGSIESFVAMMNSKVKELGCTNTNFTNTYGLHDENHYTTARDLVTIAKYCMKNSEFRHFVSQPNCHIAPTNKHEARTFSNTNDLINSSSRYFYQYATGIKTGYTKEAGNCLISSSEKDGFRTIAVVLNAGLANENHGARYTDSTALFDYGYSNFAIKNIASKNDVITQTTIFNGTRDTKDLDILLSEDITALTKLSNENSEITPTVTLNKNLSAPIAKGTVVGKVSYNIFGIEYTADLVAAHDVEKSEFLINAIRIGLVGLLLIVLIVLVIKLKRKKK